MKGSINEFANPSDVTTNCRSFVSTRPSGSKVNGEYGEPFGASSVVTAEKAASPFVSCPSAI